MRRRQAQRFNWRVASPIGAGALALLAVVLAIGIGYAADLWDTATTRDDVEKSAPAPGLEGALPVTGLADERVLNPERHGPYLFVPLCWRGGHEPLVPKADANAPRVPSDDTK